jgi:hypothetical protein
MHNLDTTNWVSFPFTEAGYNFVSKLSPISPFLSRVANLPEGAFDSMNKSAIRELVGTDLTRDEVITRLSVMNEFATHAVIELV